MKRITLAALVALPFLATPLLGAGTARAAVTEANFGAETTADLVALCAADKMEPMGTAALNFCHGYVVGAVRVAQAQAVASRGTKLFCLPEPTPNRDQAIGEFVKWAQADAKAMAMRPYDAMFAYLGAKYPCSKKK